LRGRDGLFLAVSRQDDPRDLNFPGGWVELSDEGRTARERAARAAERELMEETGYRARAVRQIWSDGRVAAFEMKLTGERRRTPRRGERGAVAWVPREVLETGSFGDKVRVILAGFR
jgi:8-oxo-dGTP pyrophosphatase MutT (NUDIX family)